MLPRDVDSGSQHSEAPKTQYFIWMPNYQGCEEAGSLQAVVFEKCHYLPVSVQGGTEPALTASVRASHEEIHNNRCFQRYYNYLFWNCRKFHSKIPWYGQLRHILKLLNNHKFI